MINSFQIENLGPIENADIKALGRINLIIGENGTGKSFILKALYSAHKSIRLVINGEIEEHIELCGKYI